MKKIFTIICTASIALGFVSCSGFLDENPETKISEAIAYASESSLESNMLGCYRALCGDAMITGNMNEFVHDASGLLHWAYSTTRLTDIRWASALNLAIYSKSQYNYNQYTGFYTVINRCNKLIEQLEGSPVDEAYKKEIDGEARFLRAVAYYFIVRCWGDAPVYLKSPTTMEEANAPRSPFWELYKIVIDDFKLAFEEMRDYNRMQSISGLSGGRTCNYAAKAMLSQVYLTIGTMLKSNQLNGDMFWDDEDIAAKYGADGINNANDAFNKTCGIADYKAAFQLAHDTAMDVINNGPFRLHDKYNELFRWTPQDSQISSEINRDWEYAERIFVIPNTVECSCSNYTAIRSLPLYMEGTSHTNTATGNSNKGRFRPTRYMFQHWCNDYPGKKGTSNGYTNEIYVDSNDPRMKTTLVYERFTQASDDVDVLLYPNSGRTCCSASSSTEMYYRKYVDPRFNADSGYADFYVMRAAELYLIVAEAAANLCTSKGDSYWNEAFEYVEKIHARARIKADGTESALPKWEANRFDEDTANSTVEKSTDPIQRLIDAIFWERIYELTFEGHEYFDTHRMGANWLSRVIARPCEQFLQHPYQKYQTAIPASGVLPATTNSYTTRLYGSPDFTYPSAEDLRKSLLFAFPNDEMTLNTAIPFEAQNKYFWQ